MTEKEFQNELNELLEDATHEELVAMLAECKRQLQTLRLAAG